MATLAISDQVRGNLRDRRNYVLDILVGHSMKHRQADQLFVGCLGNWVFATLVTKLTPIVGVEMHRNVVNIHADVFGAQAREEISPRRQCRIGVNSNGIQMPRGTSHPDERSEKLCP